MPIASDQYRSRYRKSKIFKIFNQFITSLTLSILVAIMAYLFYQGYKGFITYELVLDVKEVPKSTKELRDILVDMSEKEYHLSALDLSKLVSRNGAYVSSDEKVMIPLSSNAEQALKGNIDMSVLEKNRMISNSQFLQLGAWKASGEIKKIFNWRFFKNSASSYPEMAGIYASLWGTLYIMIVAIAISLPLGVCSAIWLSELSPNKWWVKILEVSVNNLTAIPSIMFGIFGLVIFINIFDMPRSSIFVGGMVLSLFALRIIIVSTRAALLQVPMSLREAALALGATPIQMIFGQLLPAALPNILTGLRIAILQTIGETAPLLMIGMVAFVVSSPNGFFDTGTNLPVQIYLWATAPEFGFREKASAAIVVLLTILLLINFILNVIRNYFYKKIV